ncbi:hypothetical protein RRF57_007032 [Xylaria bambusicola]|uniref:Uncharacterized protein n=1 Tax=Xylaria bambusicola TaxID=326684 RepID=A0AAN7UKD8_9PEZI
MQFARIKVGINFCESCLDHTPPDHPPINEFMEAFDELVALVSEFGLSRSDVNRFTRDIRDGLKEIRDNAALAGVDNNFYNDIKNLYELFFDRVMRARDQAIARRQARRAREQGEASGSQG